MLVSSTVAVAKCVMYDIENAGQFLFFNLVPWASPGGVVVLWCCGAVVQRKKSDGVDRSVES